jgi:predicted MPP superfamily phosphohydrolase
MMKVREWDVSPASWTKGSPPLKIAILTDIHAFEPYMPASRIAGIVETINALQPDLTVLLGDFVATGSQNLMFRIVPIPEWTAALAPLRAPLGVYAILGNHDWWLDAHRVREGLQSVGIPVLENHALKIQANGHSFWLAGLGDQIAYLRIGGQVPGFDDLPGTLAQITDNDPAIMLAHEPDIFPRIPDRIALTLSGHTHGGQVTLPFYGPPITGSKFGQRYVYGHVTEGKRHLVVSSGVGVSWYPVRFMTPPEITVVNVRPPNSA